MIGFHMSPEAMEKVSGAYVEKYQAAEAHIPHVERAHRNVAAMRIKLRAEGKHDDVQQLLPVKNRLKDMRNLLQKHPHTILVPSFATLKHLQEEKTVDDHAAEVKHVMHQY
jgi:hypothetical protein